MGLLNALTNAVTNYGDDVVRTAANQYGDDILRAAANQADDVARATANNMDDALRGLGISQNKNGQFIANGTRSYDADKSFWQKLKDLVGGDHTDPDYFMSHRPTQTGIYADDLTKMGFDDIGLPKDIYDNPQYYTYMYGETPDVMNETMAQLNAVRGNPNGQVNIYRATTGDAFNDGDWITLSPTYAKNHLRDQLDGNGRVISQKVNVHDIQHAGDDLAEWGFYPQQRILPNETQSALAKLVSNAPAVSDDPLAAAYGRLAQYKNANPEKLAQAMDTSSMLNDFDYAALLRKNEQAAINQLGADDFAALRDNVGGMLKNAPSENAYIQARQRATDYLAGANSENVARASQQFVKPGQKIYRAANSPKGISWTTNRAIAEQEKQTGAKILEYILQPDDKYISPQFTEMFSDSIAPQDQVLFNWDKLLRP